MTSNYPESGSAATDSGSTGVKDTAKEQARQTVGTAAEETRHVAGVAQGEAARVASEASSQVRLLAGQASSHVQDQGREQLGRLVEVIRSFGDDLESMAAQSSGPVAGLVSEAAGRVTGLSSALEGREPADLLEDARSFARRRSGVFLGGALVAGLVAGRLTRGAKAAKDSSPSSRSSLQASSAGSSYGDSAYDSPRVGAQGGYTVPSSGPVYDTRTQGHGTAAGDPLAGTGRPDSDPVYPGGSDPVTGARGTLS